MGIADLDNVLKLGAVQESRARKGRAVVTRVRKVHSRIGDTVHERHGNDVVRGIGTVVREALLGLSRAGRVLSCYRVLVSVVSQGHAVTSSVM